MWEHCISSGAYRSHTGFSHVFYSEGNEFGEMSFHALLGGSGPLYSFVKSGSAYQTFFFPA